VSCAQFEHADPAFALGRIFAIGTGHGLPNVPREGRKGLLEECNGGTLFLDDVDRLPLNAQDLLLYPLQGKPFEPGIGSGPSHRVSVKFVLATNRDPEKLVRTGTFRADVLSRIGTRIEIPLCGSGGKTSPCSLNISPGGYPESSGMRSS
jgi:transcriptional regulator of aromatic amino acid metabolism